MKNKNYDCIFSLGEACFMAISLRENGLRMFSGPFDWMYGSTFKTRCEVVINRFKDYFNKEDFEFKEYREGNRLTTYRNKRTDLHYNHDFHSDLPFNYEYEIVKTKYERRIKRLLEKMAEAKNVLICYADLANTVRGAKDDAEIMEEVKKINEVYAPTRVDMLYVRHNPDMKEGRAVFKPLNEYITIAETRTIFGTPELEDFEKSMKAVLKYIRISKRNRTSFRELWKKIYKIKDNRKGLRLKFCGITIAKCKNILALEYIKKKYVFEHKESIKTIILGSSYANRGVNSMFMTAPTVNLSTTSQDLYQSLNLFKYAIEHCLTIKNAILFLAPFSSGFNISHSSEKYRTAFMETTFGIAPFQRDKSIPKKFYKMPLKCFLQHFTIKMDNNPLFENEEIDKDEVKRRVNKHMEFAKNNEMNKYLLELIELAKQKGIKLYAVIPPFSSVYKKYLDEGVFLSMENICRENHIPYISFYNDEDFKDEDFCDADHLNIIGSIKLTNKINDILEVANDF